MTFDLEPWHLVWEGPKPAFRIVLCVYFGGGGGEGSVPGSFQWKRIGDRICRICSRMHPIWRNLARGRVNEWLFWVGHFIPQLWLWWNLIFRLNCLEPGFFVFCLLKQWIDCRYASCLLLRKQLGFIRKNLGGYRQQHLSLSTYV